MSPPLPPPTSSKQTHRRDTAFTYFPHTPVGDSNFHFFQKVVDFHPIQSTLAAQTWNLSQAGRQFALALFTFLYVDIIDASATLYSMARFSGVVDPTSGDFPRSTIAYCTDALTISMGSLFGCSPVTCFIESGAGIAEGGRTGLTAMTTGVCFLVSIFFAPIFASIPPWATGCTLMLVGCMMMRQVTAVNWSFIGDALPAFVTIAVMPFTYSVSYGLIAGLFTYAVLNGLFYLTKKVSSGRLEVPDADSAEYWTLNPKGGTPPWFIRAAAMLGRRNDDERVWGCGGEGIVEIDSVSGSTMRSERGADDKSGCANQIHLKTWEANSASAAKP